MPTVLTMIDKIEDSETYTGIQNVDVTAFDSRRWADLDGRQYYLTASDRIGKASADGQDTSEYAYETEDPPEALTTYTVKALCLNKKQDTIYLLIKMYNSDFNRTAFRVSSISTSFQLSTRKDYCEFDTSAIHDLDMIINVDENFWIFCRETNHVTLCSKTARLGQKTVGIGDETDNRGNYLVYGNAVYCVANEATTEFSLRRLTYAGGGIQETAIANWAGAYAADFTTSGSAGAFASLTHFYFSSVKLGHIVKIPIATMGDTGTWQADATLPWESVGVECTGLTTDNIYIYAFVSDHALIKRMYRCDMDLTEASFEWWYAVDPATGTFAFSSDPTDLPAKITQEEVSYGGDWNGYNVSGKGPTGGN